MNATIFFHILSTISFENCGKLLTFADENFFPYLNVTAMILFPNAKINIGLQVTARRPDGYHDLDTVFYPIPLCDALEIVEATAPDAPDCTLHLLGAPLAGNLDDNLVVKAVRLLRSEGYLFPPVDIWLTKHIPSGAGLGGGSSDAAFTLVMLNTLFGLDISDDHLEVLAARLGADCAVFIRNRPVYATGIGNIFTPLSIDLAGYHLVVVKPDIFVSTREAFQGVVPCPPAITLQHKVTQPVAQWKELITNDFETSIFPLHPTLSDLKQRLYHQGAVYASMSGSGSALYALYTPESSLPVAADYPDCFFFTADL